MSTNNFKLFDQNKANLLSDTEYANSTQRLNGVQTGVASSQLNNKFAYQVSLVAYAIAQIMNQNGLDATDTLSVSAFVGNLGGSLMQKVADKASSAEAAAGVLANKYISPATLKAAALLLSGGVMTGTLDMNNNQIINLPTPTSNSEPATKGYVDGSHLVTKKLFYSNDSLTLTDTGMEIPINATYDDLTNCSALTYSGIFTVYSNNTIYFMYGNDAGNGVFLFLPYNGENIKASLFVLLNPFVDLRNPNSIKRIQSIGYDSYVILTKDNTGIYTFLKAGNVSDSDKLVIKNFKIYGIFI